MVCRRRTGTGRRTVRSASVPRSSRSSRWSRARCRAPSNGTIAQAPPAVVQLGPHDKALTGKLRVPEPPTPYFEGLLVEDLELVTGDERMRRYPIRTIWWGSGVE